MATPMKCRRTNRHCDANPPKLWHTPSPARRKPGRLPTGLYLIQKRRSWHRSPSKERTPWLSWRSCMTCTRTRSPIRALQCPANPPPTPSGPSPSLPHQPALSERPDRRGIVVGGPHVLAPIRTRVSRNLPRARMRGNDSRHGFQAPARPRLLTDWRNWSNLSLVRRPHGDRRLIRSSFCRTPLRSGVFSTADTAMC